ncbi:MAG: hypothetical protein JNM52_04730 [Betaproteobacteria bacterium]|nr:hypothetical protein [Betaproteobacteria bacterium]
MKHPTKLIYLAILSACYGIAQAEAPSIEMQVEKRIGADTHTINKEIILLHGGDATSATALGEAVIAQAGPSNVKQRIAIFGNDEAAWSPLDMPFMGSAQPFGASPIKNAPYSAEVVSERTQLLPDGNQISKRSSTLTYRDSAGRSRQDTFDSKGEAKSIHIDDSVDGARYILSPAKKSATKISLDKDLSKKIEEIKTKALALAADGKAKALAGDVEVSKDGDIITIKRSGPGENIVIKRSDKSAGKDKQELREEVRVIRQAGDNTSGDGPVNGSKLGDMISKTIDIELRNSPLAAAFQDTPWAAKATTTSLGSKDIEGLRAEGKRVSYTIPAGEVGNKNPITVTTETWYSPDLKVTLYSKHSDPRSGDTLYRMSNIKRVEQPLALFSVPADYTVKDIAAHSKMMLQSH